MHFPVNFKSKIMCQQSRFLFLFLTLFTTHTAIAIKVDWNTNTGPIVPPTSTVAPVPKPPFRDPAPVWEDQSDDIPNPHQYQYVAPPPSRPRYNDPYRDKDTVVDSLAKQQYGKIIYHPNQIQEHVQSNNYNNKIVNSLTVKYVPNYGNKYVAVVPNNNNNNNIQNQNHHHPEPSQSPQTQSQSIVVATAAVPSATYNIQQKVDYNNNNNNNDIYNNNNNNNNYNNGIYNNKYEKYANYYQKYNDKYAHYKMKKYNPYGEKKKYWPIYLYNIPKQQPQQVFVYNYQNQQNTT